MMGRMFRQPPTHMNVSSLSPLQGHRSIVTLVDYFETMNNLYLVTDLCVGGELFDRICERGSYYEQCVVDKRRARFMSVTADPSFLLLYRDAAHIVKTITMAVVYLHNQGIVHRGASEKQLRWNTSF